jgi:hypothetical protein
MNDPLIAPIDRCALICRSHKSAIDQRLRQYLGWPTQDDVRGRPGVFREWQRVSLILRVQPGPFERLPRPELDGSTAGRERQAEALQAIETGAVVLPIISGRKVT